MAVLAEAISVIMRCETIEARYPGGREGYVKDAPNKTLCTDERLARVGFMAPPDVANFISRLERLGFEFVRHGNAIDMCVVDQLQGPTARCDWLEYFHMDSYSGGGSVCVAVCRETGDQRSELFTPRSWDIRSSLTRNYQWITNEKTRERLELIRHENGVNVFRDRSTGKEVYLGHTSPLPSIS